MANRFPLVIDTTSGNQFRELPDGDNLLLTNSSIVNALDITALGTVTASQLVVDGTVFRNDYNDLQNLPTIPTSILQLGIGDGTSGQFLTTNGTGTISFQNIPTQDPTMGGDLQGSASNAQIKANTIGIDELDVDDGTIGQVLATDGSGNLQFIDMSGGGGGGGATSFLGLSGQIGLSQIDDDFITPEKLKDNGQTPTPGQYLTVAAGGDFEYLDIPTTNPQWDDVQNKPTIPATLTDLGISEGNDGDVLKTDGAGTYTFTAFNSIENIEFSGTTIRTVPDNSNIAIDPKGNGYVNIIGTNGVVIPKGTSAQRAPDVAGAMRLNTELGIFEGYDGSNWNGLGGVRSVDGLTYVSAELTPNASDDTLRFITNSQTSATLTESLLDLNSAVSVKIRSTQSALDFDSGALSVDGGVSIKGNLIVSGAITVNEEFNTSVKVNATALSGGTQTSIVTVNPADIDYFNTGQKIRIFGASADNIDQDTSNLGIQVNRVGFATPDGSGNEVTFSYRVAQMDTQSGKISAVSSAVDITIEPDEINDFNNNKNLQLVVSRVSSAHNILIYRKIGSEVNYTLLKVLGPKELGVALSNVVWTDYYDFDVAPWSKRTTQGLFTTDSGLVHVPLVASATPKLGWIDTEITQIDPNTNNLTVANSFYASQTSIEVVVDDTEAVQLAIDSAKAQNRNSYELENRTYFIKRLEIPDGFTLKGSGDQTRIIKQYWSTETSTGDNTIIRPKSGYTSYSNITIRDLRIDGNAQNQYLSTDTTSEFLNFAFYLYGNDLLYENIELDNVIGGGIYAYHPTITNNLTILNSEITSGGLTYSYDYQPLYADECRTIKIAHNTFRDFPGPISVSAVQKGIVSPNIVDNCGEGIFAYGATKIVLSPNVLLGPAGEFIANPDVLNSEYDSVNITLEPNIDFNSPAYVYQENGAFFDFTANQGSLTGLINELTKVNNVEELVIPGGSNPDYSQTLGGEDYISFTTPGDANGNFQFRIVTGKVNDLLSRAGYSTLLASNPNSQGLVYRIVATEYVPTKTIVGLGSTDGNNDYVLPLDSVDGLNVSDVVRLVNHSTTPASGGLNGTINSINTISNTITIDFGVTTIQTPASSGQVALQNNFVVAKGKIN